MVRSKARRRNYGYYHRKILFILLSSFQRLFRCRKEAIRENLLLEFQVNAEEFENEREKEERKILSEKIDKLQQLVEKGEGGEKTNAERAIQNILIEKGFTRQELDNPETRLLSVIERRIQKKEDILKEIKVESLSFNSFYEFSLRIIPIICKENKIDFDITNYKFLLKKFYKGGQLEKLLMKILILPL